MSSSPGEDDPRHVPDYADLPRVEITIPDDARELDREAHQLRRERRRTARAQRFARRFPTAALVARRWRRYGLSAPLIVAVLVFVAAFGGLLVLLGPSRTPRLRAQPLASGLSTPAGQVGGLLVSDQVVHDGQLVSVRSLRPAVLVLLPVSCQCQAQVRDIVRAVTSYDVSTYLVPPGAAPSDELERLATESAQGLGSVLLDPDHVLAASYHPHRVTAVLVRADGIVAQVIRDITPGQHLTTELDQLLLGADRPR